MKYQDVKTMSPEEFEEYLKGTPEGLNAFVLAPLIIVVLTAILYLASWALVQRADDPAIRDSLPYIGTAP